MTDVIDAFRSEYREAFAAHLLGGDEAALRTAYELGRGAMLRQLSVLDLAAIHHHVLVETLESAAGPPDLRAAADAAAGFFLEVLSTYEMVQRGFAEARETARVEQHHAEQLRRLADASVAISAAGSFDELAARIPEHAVGVLGVARATVRVRSATTEPVERSHPGDPAGDPPASARLRARLERRDGSRFGELEVVGAPDRAFTGNDEAILTQLAQLAGVALENAELYDQERLVAETLQRRLLPDRLPEFPGVTMASRYLPGWAGSDIGGDWYDALVLPDRRLALVVGDVVGKGIRAAAGMGQLRIAVRAYAIEGHPPGALIELLDQVLEEFEEEFATVVYLCLDPVRGVVSFANAGHPPPLLLSADGSARFLRGALSPPLGCMAGAQGGEDAVVAAPGSTLVVYTDGLVERRGSDIERGLERLERTAVAALGDDLGEFCDRLLDGMAAAERSDDIALLAVRFDPPPGGSRQRAGGR